ncbi:hypothetical protein FJZ48_02185 [Candidatus Uhrbacteria bacterium]|nr:hypothetical protein [Candidatus Uhrbacteria bacterium]
MTALRITLVFLMASGCHEETAAKPPTPAAAKPPKPITKKEWSDPNRPLPPRRPGQPLTDINNNPCAVSYWSGGNKGHVTAFAKDLIAEKWEIKDGSPDNVGNHLVWFENLEDGLRGCEQLLGRPPYANMTLERALRVWSGGHSSKAYARKVSRDTGIGLNERIGRLNTRKLDLLLIEMARWEGGHRSKLPGRVAALLKRSAPIARAGGPDLAMR